MKKIAILIILLIISVKAKTQSNVEVRNSLSAYGIHSELLLGYEFKQVDFSFLTSLNGNKGLNTKIFLAKPGDIKIYVNQRIFLTRDNILIIDLPQLGTSKEIGKNFSVNCIVGPDAVNFFSVGIGVNYKIHGK